MIFAPTIPLEFSNTGGYNDYMSEKELAKFHLTNVLLTSKGEKISIPNYGVGIRRILFENITQATLSSLQSEIEEQIEQYVEGIALLSVSVNPSTEDDNTINVSIAFRMLKNGEQDVLSMNIGSSTGILQGTSGY